MKLYTEEQVRDILKLARLNSQVYTDDYLIESLTPIQLPTDDELLFDATTWLHNTFKGKGFEFKVYDREKNEAYNYNPVKLLKEYSIWMRDKKQEDNK